jgi:hypothetical protein
MDGDVTNPDILPEDRDAANALFDNPQDWHRYVLVYERRQADLVWAVRMGRAATGAASTAPGGVGSTDPQVRVPIGGGRNPNGQGKPGAGPDGVGVDGPTGIGGWQSGNRGGVGGSLGPARDLLWIYMKNGDDSQDTAIWRRYMDDGLSGSMPLFTQIHDAVETGCKPKPAQGSH